MPRSTLKAERLNWYRANRKHINSIRPSARHEVRQALEHSIDLAQVLLWELILLRHNLSIHRGILRTVYIGAEFELTEVYFGFAVVATRNGKYATIKFRGTRHSDD